MKAAEVEIRRQGILFIVSGPSGAGKSSVSDWALVNMGDLALSVSLTTRSRRGSEVDGVHYHFVSAAEFSGLIERDELAEWADVHGYRYGTPRSQLDEAIAGGRDILLDIDVQGAAQIREAYPQSVSIFLLPPSRAAVRARLAARATDSDEIVERRLNNACAEIRASRDYDFVIVNEVLTETFAAFAGIVRSERARVARLDATDLASVVKAFEADT